MFEEQVGWAVDAGVDYIVGETFSWAQEALIALDVIKRANKAPSSRWRCIRPM
jgi:betaine-homocysteine S-methyltransferase